MSEPIQSLIDTNFVRNYQTAEYGKFVELLDTKYPAISVTRVPAPGASEVVDIYPKYAVLTHISNTDDMQFSLSAGNINISLDTVELLLGTVIEQTNDLEKNTFDTASACDDIYWETVKLNNRFEDSPLLDAFGRLRVSEPKTLLDAKHLYDKLPTLFSEKLSGTATSTFSAGDSMVVMSTSNPGDLVIRQTRYHFNYQPGKSLQAFFTGKLNPQPGIIKRMGLFQSLSSNPSIPTDGIYLEVTNDGPYFKIAKAAGTPHYMSFPRSEWNIDKLDGTGPSGLTVAMSAAQIFVIDYEWLSLGRIRFGFMQSGKTYYAHHINHINDLDRPYITSPNQPVRYEIIQTGATPGSMHHICSTVMIEGGEEDIGKPIALSDGEVTSIGTANYKALLAVRLKSSAHDSSVILKAVDVFNDGNPGLYDVILNPSVTLGSLSWVDVDNTAVQYAAGGATVSGGYSLFKSFVGSGIGGATISDSLTVAGEIAKLGINVDDQSDIIVLAAKSLTGTTSMYGILRLLERS